MSIRVGTKSAKRKRKRKKGRLSFARQECADLKAVNFKGRSSPEHPTDFDYCLRRSGRTLVVAKFCNVRSHFLAMGRDKDWSYSRISHFRESQQFSGIMLIVQLLPITTEYNMATYQALKSQAYPHYRHVSSNPTSPAKPLLLLSSGQRSLSHKALSALHDAKDQRRGCMLRVLGRPERFHSRELDRPVSPGYARHQGSTSFQRPARYFH
jgi:hypothetical protein